MTTSTNPAWAIPSHATSPKHLQLIHKPVPVPGPGEALIRLTAASLNFRDYLITTHSPHYPGNHKDMLTPGSDGAGVVHSAGPGSIWATRVGTPVVLHPNSWMDGPGSENVLDFKSVLGGDRLDGTVQGWRVVPDGQVVEAPRGFEGWETAGLLTAGATAWRAIREWLDGDVKGRLGPWKGGKDDGGSGKWRVRRLEGKTVLTQGTGGLSCAVIQIAHALGATTICTSSSDAKLEVARSLGATHTINYKTHPDWEKEVLRLTNGKGADHVIELGGAGTLMKSLKSVRKGGVVTVIGVLTAGTDVSLDGQELIAEVLYGAKTIRPILSWSREMTVEYMQFVEAHGIKPVIARTFDFKDAIEAMETMANGTEVGKIVIKIGEAE